MLFITVPSFMCVNCLLDMDNIIYSALSHFPFFFDVVCTQVHCLPINNNYENNVFQKKVRILPSMSLDYPFIKCGEC